ncbi:pyruvate kinase [Rurimicrobium arvi]|uniref:Pyruvate kinase n=1 Tax=Rurimicrobium arvi TaxID=2049916 RepID=A0ABP8MHR3_9BACT
MIRTYLTYSRDLGDFMPDLAQLYTQGLSGIRIINKGKTAAELISRVKEIQHYCHSRQIDIEILIDLPGEKPMIGSLGSGMQVQQNLVYTLCSDGKELLPQEIPTINFLNRPDLENIKTGDIVSVADGELEMIIEELSTDHVRCRALNSFFLRTNRSFNIRGNKLPAQPLSRQDLLLLQEMQHLPEQSSIKLLVSFVTEAAPLQRARANCPGFPVLAKVENVITADRLDEVISASDGIMLGRGDLSAASRMADIFIFQQLVIERSKALNKQLIVATGLFGELKNSGKPSISDIMDFGYLHSAQVNAFLIAGSNAAQYPLETLYLIRNFNEL